MNTFKGFDFNKFEARGFTELSSDKVGVAKLLSSEKVTFYAGFDATADSFHIGHLVLLMAMANLQKAGHRPICILGGGTTMIGDPSGKTEMRHIMSPEEIEINSKKLLKQFKNYLDFSNDQALLVNNADWLLKLNYIEFLRDIGKYFRVNEMIKARGYEVRMEREDGLSFIEFNYQLLQAYDFLHLFREHGCKLQIGGTDQWSNILAGVDLIKKAEQKQVFALTLPLLTTASGGKMGKTEAGAVWLDPERTSPYEFYQYWINVDDRDVEKFLNIFTFLPTDEIGEICSGDIREAKKKLAFEATKITHGEKEAQKAAEDSGKLFGGSGNAENIPSTQISEGELKEMTVVDLLVETGLSSSKSEARKLISGGGLYIDDKQIDSDEAKAIDFEKDGIIIFRKGKKTYHKVIVS